MTLNLTLAKTTNSLEGISCYEPVDIATLNKLLKTDLLINNFKNPITRDMIGCEAKQLKKYKALTSINGDKAYAKVVYERPQGMNFGRSNPKGAIGMFPMRKKIRHTLAKQQGLKDTDIINAHPEMLLQICKANGLVCKHLDYYCSNRYEILARVMRITKCDRTRAKVLFIRLLYFGTFENWLKETRDTKTKQIIDKEICIYAFQNDLDLTAWIDELVAELKIIGEHIVKANPKIAKEIKKSKDKNKKTYNEIGSCVSFFLQEYEIRVLECIYLYCCEKGYIKDNICVLCADGIMLEEYLIKDIDILAEFKQIVKEKMGFNLSFDYKELDEDCLDILDAHIISKDTLDNEKFQIFNIEYFNSLTGYIRKKIYFEIFVCKVLRPDPAFIYIESDNEKGIDDMCFYNQSKICETFNHLKSGEFANNQEEIKFMTLWIADENIKCYNTMDFRPSNEKQEIPPHIFNLFRGFNKDIKTEYDYSKKEKILQPFHDLGIQLCGGEEKHYKFLYKYLADIIQNPQRKNPLAFIIKGKQGTGKNVWLNAIGIILGFQHYITSSNPKDFFGDYAEGFYHKLLVNMNECEGKDTFDFEGRIKSFITEDTIVLNRKFVQPIRISNLSRLIIFSNKPNPIPIDIRSKERRYVVFETTEQYLDKKYGTKFWEKLIAHFKNPQFIACLYDDLNELDLSNTDWRTERPITPAYLQMCKLYVPVEVLFLEYKLVKALNTDNLMRTGNSQQKEEYLMNCFENRWENTGIGGVELFKDYVDYCKEFGFYKDSSAFQKDIKKFYARLAELELPIIKKNPQNITQYHFNINEVLEFMKVRKWIDRSDNDYNEETLQDITGEEFTDYFEAF